MLAFRFNLSTVLHYRETQRRLREAAVAAAAARVASFEALRARIETERESEARQLSSGDTVHGGAFGAWAAFSDRARRQITALEKQAVQARKNLAEEQKRLVEADRDVRLIEEMKEDRFALWRRDFDREEAALADEAFLARRESGIIGKHGGA